MNTDQPLESIAPSELPSPAINPRAAGVHPSVTLSISAKATALAAQGERVLDFSAGQPDFLPPKAVAEELSMRLAERSVGYAPVPGTPALRALVARLQGEHHGRKFSSGNVLVSCGAKHSLATLFLVTLQAGDEVVFAAPYWVSYPEMVRLAGGTPRIVTTTHAGGFKLTPAQLEATLGPRTRYVLLNSPSNPTGVGYTREELRALGEVVVRRAPEAWLVVDDIYRTLVYDGFEATSAFRALEGLSERIIVIDGVSKSHAMTGYRIGFLIAPSPLIDAAKAFQGQVTSGASTPAQWAAEVALDESRCGEDVAAMRVAFARRRRIMIDGLSSVRGFDFIPPDGAFYVFPDVTEHLGDEHADDIELCSWLLDEHLVACVPGSAFGAPGHIRLSFATDDQMIREGIARLQAAFGEA